MKRTLLITILAILGFAIFLLVRLPASWLKGYLPAAVTCADISGTAWNGSCSALAYQGAAIGNLNWKLHPSALLSGKVAAFVDLTRGSDFARGDVEVGSGGKYTAHNLQARLPLDPSPIPGLSTGFSGNVNLNLANLQVEKNLITALEGKVEASSLYSQRDRMAIGGYSVIFPKAPVGGEPVGQVTTLDGPVDFQGTLTLTRAPGWVVNGKVRVKSDTPPELAKQLEYLGAPDADGTRQLSLEGTF